MLGACMQPRPQNTDKASYINKTSRKDLWVKLTPFPIQFQTGISIPAEVINTDPLGWQISLVSKMVAILSSREK